jgi:hypothetical protein
MGRRSAAAALCLLACSAGGIASGQAPAAPARLVVMKFDGLPPGAVDRYVRRIDPRTGRSELPWIAHLFYDEGVRFDDFYARGASLSEPSWTILDTGRHSPIKGNFEVDRNTGSVAYYLDFVSYYYDAFKKRRVYPPSVEALDAAATPMVSDAFRFEERETGLQLNRRGTKFYDFLKVGLGPVAGPVKETLGDLLVGVNYHRAYDETTRAEFLKALRDPRIRYADFYCANVDEAIHDDNSSERVLAALEDADRIIGQAYSAVLASGTANRTVFVVVSDHGLTFDEDGRYSQGVNLAGVLTSREYGANTLLVHDGPRAKYSLKGSVFNPWISDAVVVPSSATSFPDRTDRITCAMDYDGNERAHLQLRDADLVRLELLSRALASAPLDERQRRATGAAALAIVDRHRAEWLDRAAAIRRELAAIRRLAAADERERASLAAAAPPPAGRQLDPFGGVSAINASDPAGDRVQRLKEIEAELWRWGRYVEEYGALCDALERRASVATADDLAKAPAAALFGPADLGDPLSPADLLNYPVALRTVAVGADGTLDAGSTFAEINYPKALAGLRVRNAVRDDVGAAPVAFCAFRLRPELVLPSAVDAGIVTRDAAAETTAAYVVYASESAALLVLVKSRPERDASILVAPVSGFDAPRDGGSVAFTRAAWRAGLPFALFEDAALDTGGIDRATWLSQFHADREWLDAVHRTAFGLAVPNLVEVLSDDYRMSFPAADTGDDRATLARFELRRRDAMAPDLFVHAAAHWNFDVKDFNPGGNHGGFARDSMHAVLWIHGGASTRVAPGPLVVERAYDGLDFAPTVLEAAGVTTRGVLPASLVRGGFRPFPGRIAREAFRDAP